MTACTREELRGALIASLQRLDGPALMRFAKSGGLVVLEAGRIRFVPGDDEQAMSACELQRWPSTCTVWALQEAKHPMQQLGLMLESVDEWAAGLWASDQARILTDKWASH